MYQTTYVIVFANFSANQTINGNGSWNGKMGGTLLGKDLKLMLLLVLTLLASACETIQTCWGINCPIDEETLVQTGAVRLTSDQVRARVAGNTEEWTHGGAFYHSDGKLDVKWRKVKYKTTWDVNADGELCYQFSKWEQRCHYYMDRAGEIYLVEEGKGVRVAAIYDGNKFRQLGRYIPVEDRRK